MSNPVEISAGKLYAIVGVLLAVLGGLVLDAWDRRASLHEHTNEKQDVRIDDIEEKRTEVLESYLRLQDLREEKAKRKLAE